MNAFRALEDKLEELEELEENTATVCYHKLFFLPVSFQSLEDAGRTRSDMNLEQLKEAARKAKAERQTGSCFTHCLLESGDCLLEKQREASFSGGGQLTTPPQGAGY